MPNPILTLKRILQESSRVECQDSMVDGLVKEIKVAINVDVCSLYLRYENDVVLSATEGLLPTAVGKIKMPMGKGLAGTIASSQHLLNLENGANHSAYIYFQESGEEQYQGFLGVPLIFQGQTIGVLVVQVLEPRKFTEEEEAFMVTLAAHLAGNLGHNLSQELFDQSQPLDQVKRLKGIRGAPGIAIAPVLLIKDEKNLNEFDQPLSQGLQVEKYRLYSAIQSTLAELDAQKERYSSDTNETLNALLEVYIMLLDSSELSDAFNQELSKNVSAEVAIKNAFNDKIAYFQALDDPYLKARADDFKVLASKVYRQLSNDHIVHVELKEPVILAGKMLSVSHLARFDIKQIVGILSHDGSALSHISVLASALGIPAVVGLDYSALQRMGDQEIIMDGNRGLVIVNPPEPVFKAYERIQKQAKSLDHSLSFLKDMPAETRDGIKIDLLSNTGLLADIEPGLQRGSEGVGLYRSEIPFMVNSHFPTEEEQFKIYRKILKSYHPKPVAMRTLDIGGDKPLPYFPIHEENPFLGWRGIRFSLDYTNILLEQIRAMLLASEGLHNLSIMMPMFSREDELTRFITIIDQAIEQLQQEGHQIERPKIGVMIEVPSAIWLINRIRNKIDFISIGSNDLTQYLLAVDRNNSRVAPLFDYFHPSVLMAHKTVIEEANRLNINVSVCGEMAGDPLAIVLLIGMGLKQLSMSAFKLPKIKAIIRHLDAKECRAILSKIMSMNDEKKMRTLLVEFLESNGAEELL